MYNKFLELEDNVLKNMEKKQETEKMVLLFHMEKNEQIMVIDKFFLILLTGIRSKRKKTYNRISQRGNRKNCIYYK